MTRRHTIIRNGRLVNARHREGYVADILIEGDTIVAVGVPGMDQPDDAVLIDAADHALIPGLVNGHVHGHGTLAKGLVGPLAARASPQHNGSAVVQPHDAAAVLAQINPENRDLHCLFPPNRLPEDIMSPRR